LFDDFKVLNPHELESRHEIFLEQYFMHINIEAETTQQIAKTMIVPAAIRYFNELAAVADRGTSLKFKTTGTTTIIGEVNDLLNELVEKLATLVKVNKDLGGDTVESKAHHMYDNVIPAMNAVREVSDKLESVVPDDYWPLPTYREMLFIK
jgi:glutamine synthetase